MLIFGQFIGHLAAPAVDPFTSCRNLNFCSSNRSCGSIVKWWCVCPYRYQFRTCEVIGSASALGHGSACNASAGKSLWNGCKLGGGWPTASDLVNYTASLQIIENQSSSPVCHFLQHLGILPHPCLESLAASCRRGRLERMPWPTIWRYNFDGNNGHREADSPIPVKPCHPNTLDKRQQRLPSVAPPEASLPLSPHGPWAPLTYDVDGAGCGAHDSNEERFPSSKFGRSGAHPTCPGCCCGHSHSEWAYHEPRDRQISGSTCLQECRSGWC